MVGLSFALNLKKQPAKGAVADRYNALLTGVNCRDGKRFVRISPMTPFKHRRSQQTRLDKNPVILLGPILHARGVQENADASRWRVSALFLLAGDGEPPDLRVEGIGLPVPPRYLHQWPQTPLPLAPPLSPLTQGPARLWRYDFAVPRAEAEREAIYGFVGEEDRSWCVTTPGHTLGTTRIAYVACGGAEKERATLEQAGLARNERWSDIATQHRAAPLHLLLMGGDQIYADDLWDALPSLAPFAALSVEQRARRFVSEADEPALERELDAWYLERYREAWSQPDAATVLARVASLCMWDDHDIIDGWGSFPLSVLFSPLYQRIYRAARRAFRLFQIGMTDDDPADSLLAIGPPNFCQGMILNGVGILAPDLRSERRPDAVLSARSWQELPGWLDRFSACRHLLFMSSTPVLFPGMGALERFLAWLPGRQRLEDDLRDQWRSPAHVQEWHQLLAVLTDFSERTGVHVTILSGEVHLNAFGSLKTRQGVVIRQCISAGVVHPPPKGLAVRMLDYLCRRHERLPQGMTLEMHPLPGLGRHILDERAWLRLESSEHEGFMATWRAEGTVAAIAARLF
jgi:PhoD related phosphatase